MAAPVSSYSALKSYVARRGGARLSMHRPLRDRLVDMAVDEFPVDCPPDRLEEVLRARMAVRIRKQYGGIVATFLISVIVNAVVRIIIEWWFARHAHRVLMAGWHQQLHGGVE